MEEKNTVFFEQRVAKCRGVYLLIVRVPKETAVETRRKMFGLNHGYYVYVGSARGGGGVFSRVKRYFDKPIKKFWHVDYLLVKPGVSIEAVCFKCTEGDYESRYAGEFRKICYGVRGFGCSDKPMDYSHLYLCGLSLEEVYEKIRAIDDELDCLDRSSLVNSIV